MNEHNKIRVILSKYLGRGCILYVYILYKGRGNYEKCTRLRFIRYGRAFTSIVVIACSFEKRIFIFEYFGFLIFDFCCRHTKYTILL